MLVNHGAAFSRLKVVRVDQGSKGWLVEWASKYTHITIEVVEKPEGQKGFALIPKRWVVERTFAWLGRNRRLSKDYERLPQNSESWMYLASMHLMLKRLAPA